MLFVMSARAFLFPGQGVQFVGMLRPFASHPLLSKLKGAGYGHVIDAMLHGPEEKLRELAQPAVFIWSMLSFYGYPAESTATTYFLGHSVGEYAALTAAGALSLEDGLKLVNERSKAMNSLSLERESGMYAVISTEIHAILVLCKKHNVSIAAINSKNQIVISGYHDDLRNAISKLPPSTKIKRLNVSKAFHSPTMEPAKTLFRTALLNASFNRHKAQAVICNFTAEPFSLDNIEENLLNQITSTVQWDASMEKLPRETLILEVAGKTLSRLHPHLRFVSNQFPIHSQA